ncbi:MAG: alpha/beta fold hydrolase [Myxococcota bacterium]
MNPQTRRQRILDALAAEPYRPAHGLANPHAQTVYAPYFRRTPEVGFARDVWATPDDDFLRVSISEGRADRPVAILIHGLEGSVEAPYIPGLASLLEARGYTVVAYDQRGCGGEMNRARRLYHCGVTDDIQFVVDTVLARWPGRRLVLCGVSLGGNQLGKWLGTHDVPSAILAAAIVSPPFDLVTSGAHMDARGWLYVKHFLRTLIPKALEKERQFPGSIDRDAVAQAKTFEQFDTHATAALHGFRDAHHYYSTVACGQYLPDVATPTLLLAAEDDPFNPGDTIPHATVHKNPYLHGLFPSAGGHVGFISGLMHRPKFWGEDQVMRFFELNRELD